MTSVTRATDADEYNRIINHPTVFPFLTIPGLDRIDASPLLADPRNVLLMVDGGGILFSHDEPGVYGMHPAFLKGHRGSYAIDAALEAYRWMFTRTDCVLLLARVPVNNKAALRFVENLGFEFQFERLAAWPTPNRPVDMRFSALSFETFLRHHPIPFIETAGDIGISYRCRWGAFLEMSKAGQGAKAVALFNRWARFALLPHLIMPEPEKAKCQSPQL